MIGLLITIIGFSVVGAAMQRLLGGGAPFLLGVGTVGLTLYVTLLLHIPMIPVLVLLFLIALLIVWSAGDLARVWRAGDLVRQIPRTRPSPATIVTAIPILALLFAGAILPLADFDGRAFWVLKAKAIASEGLVDGPFFQGTSAFSPKNEYPLLVPIANAAVMTASGVR